MMNTPASSLGRLCRRSDFLFVRQGQSERRRALVIQARAQRNNADIRIGFTATKKIGNAVIRNRAKRRLRAAARALLPHYGQTGVDYVFIARRETANIAWTRLLDDMETALISLARRLAKAPTSP